MSTISEIADKYLLTTYRRSIALVKGRGRRVWDSEGREYLDFGGGVAVSSLGHAHPAMVEALHKQSQLMIHSSNLYYNEPQALLARELVESIGEGRVFFSNSGAEANEGLYKLSRLFGRERGAYEIITMVDSFHGRTMGGISATGQEKVKHGFEPLVPSFVHVPFNDIEAVKAAVTPKTVAVLIEGVQGEGGIFPAKPEYLLALRKLTKEKGLLLLLDAVQCGFYRTGRFQSYERILEGVSGGEGFRPDAIAMAKAMGGGFPMGAFWVSAEHASLFTPGSHGSTYAGSPLACAVGLAVLDTVRKEKLDENISVQGARLLEGLKKLKNQFPVIEEVRGLGGLVGLQLSVEPPDVQPFFVKEGLLLVGAANRTLRYLPPFNTTADEVDEALDKTAKALSALGKR